MKKRNRGLAGIVGGAWAIDRRYSEAFRREIEECYALRSAEVIEAAAAEPVVMAEQRGSVMVVDMIGPFMKSVPSWLSFFGVEAVDSQLVASIINAAAADDSVDSIVLNIDSPGGQVAGTEAVADAVKAAAAVKPVHAHIDDLGASAAYWVASQASTISMNRTGQAGSIGVYAEVWDVSSAFADEGIVVHVISSGEDKGRMVEGTKIESRDLELLQEEIDALAAIFIEAVAEGRNMKPDQAKAIATGRTWLAKEALDIGLIDSIGSLPEAIASLTAPSGASIQGDQMSLEENGIENLVEVPAEGVDLEAVAMELEKTKAEAEAAKAALREFKEGQKAASIAAAIEEGRVTPPMVAAVEKHAALCEEPDELKAFLDCLPVQTRKAVAGSTEPAATLTDEERAFCKRWKISEEQFLKGKEK